MANPWAGEVEIVLDGRPHVARLTLGALAELEAGLAAESLLDLVARFEGGRFSSRDVLALVVAGLRGGGWPGIPEGGPGAGSGYTAGSSAGTPADARRSGCPGGMFPCVTARIVEP